ncbi:hypothetical protein [Actinomadura opuntiae]|uniref:hypothetical protein n=1 Tax=Actinomadura sp. OS1-43 TaxID=604315 RepID=UPI00255AB7A2|nr:hypothetical protein [Actinomadura sp. OS1-43]MDL4814265.1 hypothetical protein [Actinomadura sp. OS1-43]
MRRRGERTRPSARKHAKPTAQRHAELAARLRAAARARQPDDKRIWERVRAGMQAGMDEPGAPAVPDEPGTPFPEDPRPRSWPRVLTAAAATMAVAGAVSAVTWRLASPGGAPGPPAARHVVETPAAVSTERSGPAVQERMSPSRGSSPSSPARTPKDGEVAAAGTLDARSTAYWAQNNLTLKVRRPLHELSVTIRVARTKKVAPTGSWLSLPNGDFNSTTETSGNTLVYGWTLLPGRTVRPGSYVLAAQYNRAAGHDPRHDTFTLKAGAATLTGHF